MASEDLMPDETELVRLSFALAGRFPDPSRDSLVDDAAAAQWDLLVEGLAGAVMYEGLQVTAEELETIAAGLRWLDSPYVDRLLETAVVISDAEVSERLQQWRFEPAEPSGEPYERATVTVLEGVPAAKALVTAWRTGPDGSRVRVCCVVCDGKSERFWGPEAAWGRGSPETVWGRVHHTWRDAMRDAMRDATGRSFPAGQQALLEVVWEGQPWTVYHRRLVEAARPVWTRTTAP